MRIGIDLSSVAKAERTGVARYGASLAAALPAALGPDDRVDLLCRLSRWGRRRYRERVADPRFRTRWFQDGVVAFGAGGLDVVHGPDLRIPRLRGVPAVSTVHDLSAIELPGIANDDFRRRKEEALEDVAARAAVIVCISDSTRESFVRRFPSSEPRTRVIPLGLSATFRPQEDAVVESVRRARGLVCPYILFVGQISARKNLLPLVAAFGRLHAAARAAGSPLDLDLVLAGPVQTGGENVAAAARSLPDAQRVRFLGFVTDDELPGLYAGARAFCFTGKGEGFGLPILEAMACRCPVVIARAGANSGTAGGAASEVDADNDEELAAAVSALLPAGGRREDAIRLGLARASRFSWQATATATVSAYRDAAASGARR